MPEETKTIETPEQLATREAAASAAAAETDPLADLVTEIRGLRDELKTSAKAVAEEVAGEAVRDAASKADTKGQKRMDAAIAESSGGAQFELPPAYRPPGSVNVDVRAYGSAGRTQPAMFADHRYSSLPEWQQSFRTPQADMLISRFFIALQAGDQVTLREIRQADNEVRLHLQRAGDLNIGDSTGDVYDGSVGPMVPLILSSFIHTAMYRTARMSRFARMSTGPNVRYPKQSAVSTSTWTGESLPAAAGEGAVAEFLFLLLHDLTSLAVNSNRAIRDAVGLVNWLLGDMARQMQATADATFYATGTGTLQPNSLELADTIVATPASNPLFYVPSVEQAADETLPGSLTLQVMQTMWRTLHEGARANAVWMGNDTVMNAMSNVKDETGKPIFQMRNDPVGLMGDFESGATISSALSKPVVNMPGKEAADPAAPDETENRLYLIDMQNSYAINEPSGGGDIDIAVNTQGDTVFANNETQYRFIKSADGGVFGNGITGIHNYVFTGAVKEVPA